MSQQKINYADTLQALAKKYYNQIKGFVFTCEHPQDRFWQANTYATAILSAAERKDSKKIASILKQKKISLNTKIAGDTVIYKLAQAHNPANLCHILPEKLFKKHIEDIAKGQATAGRIDACEHLRKKYALQNTNQLACAAARGGHYTYAESLLSDDPIDKRNTKAMAAQSGDFTYCFTADNTREDIIAIAEGAAMGGWYTEVERLRHDCQLPMHNIANRAAEGGWIEYAELLCEQGQADIKAVLEHAARGGHLKLIYNTVHKYKVPIETIIAGAASGGHHLYCLYELSRNPEHLSIIARVSARYGYIDFSEYLRVNHNAKINDISQGATLGGQSDYVRFLVENHDADITNIALASIARNDHSEIMRALDLGADATKVIIAAINTQCQQIVTEVILRKLYTFDALAVAKVAMDNQQYALVKQMIPLHNLCRTTLASHGLAVGANTFVEMLREQGDVSTVFCACKALEHSNYDYLDYLEQHELLPRLSLAQAAVQIDKTAFAEAAYQTNKTHDMAYARLYLDYMLMGAVRANNVEYLFELLGRGASKTIAIYTAAQAQQTQILTKLTTQNFKANTNQMWVAYASGGHKEHRAELIDMFNKLENTEAIL